MNEPLRVLHMLPTFWIGGAERLVLNLMRNTDPRRIALSICVLKQNPGDSFQADFEQLGLPLYCVGAKRLYDARAVMAIVRYVRSQRVQVIHTHLLGANVLGRIAGRLAGIPVVSTLHNEPNAYRHERIDYYWLERITARLFSTQLVAVSEHLRSLFITKWDIPEKQIMTINNAVPGDRLVTIPPGTPENDVRLGVMITNIGRLNPQKGQHVLLDAAKIVLGHHPDARFQFVGQGPLEDELKEYAQTLELGDSVVFAGVSFDIPAVLAHTDIFVLSSLWEGLPITALEAMAAARPVILTDVGGNRDLIDHGVDGLLVPSGDASAIASALLSLLYDEPRRRAMGQVARRTILDKWSIEVVAAQYEALYETVWQEHYQSSMHKKRTSQ